jgi:hypothetical protein
MMRKNGKKQIRNSWRENEEDEKICSNEGEEKRNTNRHNKIIIYIVKELDEKELEY